MIMILFYFFKFLLKNPILLSKSGFLKVLLEKFI